MDRFSREILQALRGDDLMEFQEMLSEVGFSHNTLREHLNNLVEKGLVERGKKPQMGPGRPTYVYRLPVEVKRSLSSLLKPELGLVSLPFDRLRSICRHEKGGYCKEIRGRCEARKGPKITK